MKNYFEYEVKVWEDGDEETYYGVTYGDDFVEAVDNLVQFFGEADLLSLKIEPWDCEGCLIMSKEVLDELRKSI